MDALRRAARRLPESVAVIDAAAAGAGRSTPPVDPNDDGVWTFSELDRSVDAVASGLARTGLQPGDLVAMRLPPSPEAVALVHAVTRSGGVLLPLNPSWTESEIAAGLRATGKPKLSVDTPGEVAAWIAEGALRDEDRRDVATPPPDAPAVVVLTSGSSGSPRPVSLTHGNLEASANRVIERLALRPDDGWLTSLSLAHVGGIALIHRAACVGCRLITSRRFDAAEVSDLIDRGTVTHASLVPVMLGRLLTVRGERPAPSSLRCLLVGGAAAPRPLVRRAVALGYPVALTYGLTEATSQVATAPPDLVRRKPGTVGRPLSGLEVRAGAEGGSAAEIQVRGPTIAAPMAAEASMDAPVGRADTVGRADSEPASPVHLDSEGWLHTGDLGAFDGDGDLWITGRIADRIVTGGVTVEPAEVEAALAECPGVRDVAVVGAPDEEWGERLVAVIVPRDPARPPSLEEILDFSRVRLSGAKRPRELRLVTALPRNANGKLDRGRLRRS